MAAAPLSRCSASPGGYATVASTYQREGVFLSVSEQRGRVRELLPEYHRNICFLGLVHSCDNVKVGRPTIYGQLIVLQSSDLGCNLCIGSSMSRTPIYVITCHLDALS